MPVEDKPVLPRNSVGADYKPGCWNKHRTRHQYTVKNGFKMIYIGAGEYESKQMWKIIKDPGTLGCQQDGDLPECAGCTHLNPALSAKARREMQQKLTKEAKNEQS